MRLRKNMKRTAAAALALSMAVSTAAMPASAGFNIDMSKVKGDVTITKDENDKVTVTVGENTYDKDNLKDVDGITYDDKDDSDATITGDNRGQAVENEGGTSENKAEDAEAVTQEQTNEDNTEEEPSDDVTQDSSDAEEEKAAEDAPTEGETESGDAAADTQEAPEETEETRPETKAPAADEEKDDDKDTMTYEAENKSPVEKVAKAFSDTIRSVVKIINNSSKNMNVTLDNVTVDAGDRAEDAMNISGTGDVTLNVKGNNTLVGGSNRSDENEYGNGLNSRILGLDTDDYTYHATLTITSEDGNLTAIGGGSKNDTKDSKRGAISAGNGIYAGNIKIDKAEIIAKGGDLTVNTSTGNAAVSGSGFFADRADISDDAKIEAYGGTAQGNSSTSGGSGFFAFSSYIENSSIRAKGGAAMSKTNAIGGDAFTTYNPDVKIKNSKIYAVGGNVVSEDSNSTGGAGWYFSYEVGDEKNHDIEDSHLELTGGDVEGSGVSGAGIYTSEVEGDVSIKNSTLEISAGDAKGEEARTNGTIIGELYDQEKDGSFVFEKNSKVMLNFKDGYTADRADKVQNIVAKDGANVKIFLHGDEDGEELDNLSAGADEGGYVYIYRNSDLVSAEDENNYWETADMKKKPTCTEDGEDNDGVRIPAAGHNYVNGVCSICGAHEGETPDQPEENGSSDSASASFTVVGADAYEASLADGRYVIAVPADAAVLEATLGDLRVLKEQGAEVLVFRTQSRESVLNIDEMLALGTDATPFTLTHSGTNATLTVGGVEHNELL